MDGRNDVAQSSVGLMVVEGNTSWERMFGSAIMAVMSSSFYRWRKESRSAFYCSWRRDNTAAASRFRLGWIWTPLLGQRCLVIGERIAARTLEEDSFLARTSQLSLVHPERSGMRRRLMVGGSCLLAWWYGGWGRASTRGEHNWSRKCRSSLVIQRYQWSERERVLCQTLRQS